MREFDGFMNAEPANPPAGVSESLLARVRADLHPSPWLVFVKLSLIHFVTALATLSICPQFGFRLLGQGPGLMGYFMRWFGEVGCMLACGFFFLGTSIAVAIVVLRPEEIAVIRRRRLFELGALTLLSIGFFLMVDVAAVLEFYLAWAAGSLVGGILTLEIAWKIRARRLGVAA